MQNFTQDSFTPTADVLDREAIREQFGADKLALVLEMAVAGDELADAVVREERELGARRSPGQLDDGIRQGLDSLAEPPRALRAFLQNSESVPSWIDSARIHQGSEAYLSVGPIWLTLALGPGSLVHTYSSPAIARVLMQTGNLDARTARRLAETGTWNHQVCRPGALQVGAPGYVHNLQVRMLHARVRNGLLRKDWNVAELGMPISQLDLARTWLDFTYVPFRALESVGITFTPEEIRDMYALWHLIAHQLGVAPNLYRLAHDQPSGAELLSLINACTGEPDDNSRILTQKTLQTIGPILQSSLQMPTEVSIDFAHALCRHFQGDAMADKLGIAPNWTSSLIAKFADANRYQRLQERSDSQLRQRRIKETIAALDQMDRALQGPTTYQRDIHTVSDDQLPQTA